MTNKNEGRRVRIAGDEDDLKVYTVEPDGEVRELDCRAVTVSYIKGRDGYIHAEAMVYFSSPVLDIEAPRSADGVRAG